VGRTSLDPDLPDARSHTGHGLPVSRIKTLLDPQQLKPATLRARAGKALRSLRDDPSQKSGFFTCAIIQVSVCVSRGGAGPIKGLA
jgi:hypothetical protein